jgi:hypothetical protein
MILWEMIVCWSSKLWIVGGVFWESCWDCGCRVPGIDQMVRRKLLKGNFWIRVSVVGSERNGEMLFRARVFTTSVLKDRREIKYYDEKSSSVLILAAIVIYVCVYGYV